MKITIDLTPEQEAGLNAVAAAASADPLAYAEARLQDVFNSYAKSVVSTEKTALADKFAQLSAQDRAEVAALVEQKLPPKELEPVIDIEPINP